MDKRSFRARYNTPGYTKQYLRELLSNNFKKAPIRCCVFVDRYVILGGHRDAWVFGGIDPMSGAAVTHEIVRSAGRMLRKGKKILSVHEHRDMCLKEQLQNSPLYDSSYHTWLS